MSYSFTDILIRCTITTLFAQAIHRQSTIVL